LVSCEVQGFSHSLSPGSQNNNIIHTNTSTQDGGISVVNDVDVNSLDESISTGKQTIELNSKLKSSINTISRLKKLELIYSSSNENSFNNNNSNNNNINNDTTGVGINQKTPRTTKEIKSGKSYKAISTNLNDQQQKISSNLSLFKLNISNDALSAANAVVSVKKGIQKIELQQPQQQQQQKQSVKELSTDYEILERLLVNDLRPGQPSADMSSSLNELKVAIGEIARPDTKHTKPTKSGKQNQQQQQQQQQQNPQQTNTKQRKLIFKRNFSDESSEESNVTTETTPAGKVKVSVKLPVVENEETNTCVPKSEEFSSDSIHRVYEKTKLLIRNFYKNFDLLNENQQKLESQIALEQGASAEVQTRVNSINLHQNRGKEINSILTNTPYTPHWFNIATMGTNNSK